MMVDPSKLEPRKLTLESNLIGFDCGDNDLIDFLLHDALEYQENYLAHTTLLYFDGKLIGYYTLACDAIRLDVIEKKTFKKQKNIYSYPAIKLARIAFIKEYQNQGCGSFILNVIVGFVHNLNKQGSGCRFITVDAYPKSMDFYIKKGFVHNSHEVYKDKSHPSLRLDVWSYSN